MKRLAWLTLVALATAGCGGQKIEGPPIRVGVVDTVRIVNELPEFREMNLEWVRETGDFYEQLPRTKQELNEKRLQAIKQDIAYRSKTWEKKSTEFFKDAHQRIMTASEEVAREKGLEILIVDTPYVPAVQYTAGENITTDVLIRLSHK